MCEAGIRDARAGTERRIFFFFLHSHFKQKFYYYWGNLIQKQGQKLNIDTFGALLINVPTTAIFLLHYAEHSNVFFYLFIASQEVMIVLNTVVF